MTKCVNCQKKLDLIIYNDITYCKKCYDGYIEYLIKLELLNNKNREKKYSAPVEILPNLYIGSLESVNIKELQAIGINKIIIAGKHLKNSNHDHFDYLELLIDDSLEQEILEHCSIANNFIDNNKNYKILIHCYSGISRSATILISHIMYKFKINFNDAFKLVKEKYPKANPKSNFVNQLKKLYPIVLQTHPM